MLKPPKIGIIYMSICVAPLKGGNRKVGYMSLKINGHDVPVHVSYSSLTTYLDCGWKYYLSRIAKQRGLPSWWLLGGSAVHAATESYDMRMWEASNA